jgi:O-antigen/teichoic acid export membrane protein
MGEYSFIIWLIGVMVILVGIGFPNTITKFVSELIGSGDKKCAQAIYTRLLQIQLIVALLITIILIGIFYPKLLSAKRDYYLIAFLSLTPLCVTSFLSSTFHGLQNFKITSIVGSFINLFQLILIIVFVNLDVGLRGLVVIPLISGIVHALSLGKCMKRSFSLTSSLTIAKEHSNRIIKYALSFYWILVVSMITWQKLEIFFLKIYSNSEEIAFYSIAFDISMIMIGLTTLFSTVVFPVLSGYYGVGDREAIQNIYNKSIKAIIVFYLPICIIVIAIAKPIVSLMYSSHYSAVSPLLIILIVSSVFSALGILFANLILAVNRADIQAKYVTLIALTNIILDFILIPRYGATGAAFTNFLVRIIAFPIWMGIIQKQLGFSFPIREASMSILPNIPLACIVCLVGNYYSNILGIALVVSTALLLYPLLLFVFRTITNDDIRTAKAISTILPAPYEKVISTIVDKIPMRQGNF